MLLDIVDVQLVKDYILYLRFENGIAGEIDISRVVPFQGVFEKFSDLQYFQTVVLDHELGTIVWDNGADLSPSHLYSLIQKENL